MKWFLIIIVALALSLTGCQSNDTVNPPTGNDNTPTTGEPTDETEEIKLTLEELAAYNGKDGMPAYVAHDNIIYDVSDIPEWENGTHNGQFAGTDLTGVIEKAPHGVKNLELATVVGVIVE